MISQILYECKKIWRNKWMWLAFVGVLGLSISTSKPSFNSYMGQDEHGVLLQGKDAYWKTQEIAETYEGVMDEAWFARLAQDLAVAQKADIERKADHDKMKEAYGEQWMNLYLENPSSFVNERYQSEMPEDSRILYENPKYTASSIQLNFLEILNNNYANVIRERLWEVEDTKEIQEHKQAMGFAKFNMAEEEKNVVQEKLNNMTEFYYGSSDGWGVLLDIMASSYFFLPMFVLLTLANMFNKERSAQMLELMRTTRHGKKKVAISKVIASALVSISYAILFMGVVSLYVKVSYGLGNPNALVSLTTNAISPFTFQDAYRNGCMLFLLGCLVVGMTSSLLSCFCKTSYASLGFAVLIFVLPNIIPLQLMGLFPIQFMELTSTVVNPGLIQLFDSVYFIKDITWPWLIVVLFASGAIYAYYRTYTFMKE